MKGYDTSLHGILVKIAINSVLRRYLTQCCMILTLSACRANKPCKWNLLPDLKKRRAYLKE